LITVGSRLGRTRPPSDAGFIGLLNGLTASFVGTEVQVVYGNCTNLTLKDHSSCGVWKLYQLNTHSSCGVWKLYQLKTQRS